MTTRAQLAEIHRLAVAGQETAIAQETGARLVRKWRLRPRPAQ